MGFPGDTVVKNPLPMQEIKEMWVSSLGWEEPLVVYETLSGGPSSPDLTHGHCETVNLCCVKPLVIQ